MTALKSEPVLKASNKSSWTGALDWILTSLQITTKRITTKRVTTKRWRRRRRRQPLAPDRSLHNRVVGVISHVSQMAKAPTHLLAQVDAIEQLLQEQPSGERSELLILELQREKVMGFLNGFSFAIPHLKWPSARVFSHGFVATNDVVKIWPLFIFNGLYAHIQA